MMNNTATGGHVWAPIKKKSVRFQLGVFTFKKKVIIFAVAVCDIILLFLMKYNSFSVPESNTYVISKHSFTYHVSFSLWKVLAIGLLLILTLAVTSLLLFIFSGKLHPAIFACSFLLLAVGCFFLFSRIEAPLSLSANEYKAQVKASSWVLAETGQLVPDSKENMNLMLKMDSSNKNETLIGKNGAVWNLTLKQIEGNSNTVTLTKLGNIN